MRLPVYVLAGVATIAVAFPAALRAQAVDYATLQEMFGEPVTTSVTGKPQRASAAPASITIITREQIARSPARSVPDLLKAYAAVDVNRWTAGQSDVAVRGGVQPYNAQLLVLVNGRQVYLDHYGMTDWNLLGVPLDVIQQIELVRGPATALFGFNAAIGVVNIITVDPAKGRQAAVTVEGGNHGYSRFSGFVAVPVVKDLVAKLSGGRRRENERHIPDRLDMPPTINDVTADEISGSLVATPGAMTRVELQGGYADNHQLELLPNALLAVQHFRSRTAGAIVDHDTGWGSIDGQAYANWLDAAYNTTGLVDAVSQYPHVSFRNRIAVVKASSLARVRANNTVRVGLEYRNNQIYSGDLYSQRVGYQVAAVNGMADLHPSDRVTLSLAGRVDHLWLDQGGSPRTPIIEPASAYDRALTRASFNAALLVRVGADGQLRINGGRGVQSPSLIDFGLFIGLPLNTAPFPIYVIGNPRIEPTTVWSGEIGYSQLLAADVRLEGSVFVTRTADAIAFPGDQPTIRLDELPVLSGVTRLANVGAFETYGVSVAGSGRMAQRVGWLANYTWTRVHQTLPGGPPYAVTLAPAATTPEHVANIGLDYGGGRWFGGATARYTSSTHQFVFDRDEMMVLLRIPRAIGVDAKIGYHVTGHLDAYAAGENLSAAGGAAGSPIPADRRLRVGLTYRL
ncbi:TonB-dependent receptor plug domain-containing protein [Sphingomonas sp.]|uniref:TonB-dependent receptor plug domain-containing protein n=1 Tax=Sphingomonas sp. TaxID=28214 RepID=UPI003B007E75